MSSAGIEIRPVQSLEECLQVQRVQQRAWGSADIEIVPVPVLVTMYKNEALFLAAYEGLEMVGFTFGWLATRPESLHRPVAERLKYCSHMTAVVPDRQNQNIGFRLKLAQRDFAMARGVSLITWTFDPLEGRNARLNFGKLGVVCKTFLHNVYGQMADTLNAGLPSDRFQVDWWIATPRVAGRLAAHDHPPRPAELLARGASLLNAPQPGVIPRPAERLQPIPAGLALIEVPVDFQAIKRVDLAIARSWREHLGLAFDALFSAGYQAVEFVHGPVDGQPRSFYLLEPSS